MKTYLDETALIEPFMNELPHAMTKRMFVEIKESFEAIQKLELSEEDLKFRYWKLYEVILDDARDILAQYFNGDTQARILEYVSRDQFENDTFEEDYRNFINLFSYFAFLDHKANEIGTACLRASDLAMRGPAIIDTLIIPIIFYLFQAKRHSGLEKSFVLEDNSNEIKVKPVKDMIRASHLLELKEMPDKTFIDYQARVKNALFRFESSHFRYTSFEEKRSHLNDVIQEVFKDESDNHLSNLDELIPHEDVKCLINYGTALEEDVLSFWKARYKLNNYSRGYFIVFPKRAKEEDEIISRSQDEWLTAETKIWYVSTEKSHKVYEVQTKDKEGAIKLRGDAHNGLLFLAWHRFSYPEEKNVDVSLVRRGWLGENPVRYGSIIRSAAKSIEMDISKSPFEFNKIKTKSDFYELKDVIPFIYI